VTGPHSEDQVDVTQSSVGELLKDVATDLTALVSQEIALAKAEVTQEAKKAGKVAGAFGGAAGAGYFMLLFGSLTLVFLLAGLFDSYRLGALAVTVLYGLITAVLALKGRASAKKLNPKPEQTIESLKEDAQWAKSRNS
jgi:uncharacterized membrane protein YqjE